MCWPSVDWLSLFLPHSVTVVYGCTPVLWAYQIHSFTLSFVFVF